MLTAGKSHVCETHEEDLIVRETGDGLPVFTFHSFRLQPQLVALKGF